MKRWTVYCHTHVASGRRYVGLTSKTVLQRWNQHVYTAKSSKGGRWHFPNAIRKYGKDAFSHHVIMVLGSLELANAWEDFWIDFLDTRNPEHGLNLMKGGAHVPHPVQNPWDRPEYRAKMANVDRSHLMSPAVRAANRAAINTPESRAKRSTISRESQARLDVKAKLSAANKGKVYGDEFRSKMSRIRTGMKHTPEAIAKISAASRRQSPETRAKRAASCSKPRGPQAIESMRRYFARERADRLTQSVLKCCKIHGPLPSEQCYVRWRSERELRIECKLCMAARARAKRHKVMIP